MIAIPNSHLFLHKENNTLKNEISIKHSIKIINLGAINCPVGRNGLKNCLSDFKRPPIPVPAASPLEQNKTYKKCHLSVRLFLLRALTRTPRVRSDVGVARMTWALCFPLLPTLTSSVSVSSISSRQAFSLLSV